MALVTPSTTAETYLLRTEYPRPILRTDHSSDDGFSSLLRPAAQRTGEYWIYAVAFSFDSTNGLNRLLYWTGLRTGLFGDGIGGAQYNQIPVGRCGGRRLLGKLVDRES